MEFLGLREKIDKAGRDNFETCSNLRPWMLYFKPGDGAPVHSHKPPEAFLAIDGKCSVKGIGGDEYIIAKNDVV